MNPEDWEPIQGMPTQNAESPHEYQNNMDTMNEIAFADDVECLCITFDERSRTEQGHDYVRFYKDANKTSWWGEISTLDQRCVVARSFRLAGFIYSSKQVFSCTFTAMVRMWRGV